MLMVITRSFADVDWVRPVVIKPASIRSSHTVFGQVDKIARCKWPSQSSPILVPGPCALPLVPCSLFHARPQGPVQQESFYQFPSSLPSHDLATHSARLGALCDPQPVPNGTQCSCDRATGWLLIILCLCPSNTFIPNSPRFGAGVKCGAS